MVTSSFFSVLPEHRRARVFSVAFAATVSLYMLVAFVAEPTRGLALNEDVYVQVSVLAVTGLSCDASASGGDGIVGSGETLTLPSIYYTGDTGAYANSRAAKCFIRSNDADGYTLSWRVVTGSGTTNGKYGTGHLVSFHSTSTVIQAFGTGSDYTATWGLLSDHSVTTAPFAANDSRWGGRVSSTSSGTNVAPLIFGTDGGGEKWARVQTGSTRQIRETSAASQHGSGDLIRIGFRATVGALKLQAASTYKAKVTFTLAAK